MYLHRLKAGMAAVAGVVVGGGGLFLGNAVSVANVT